MFGRGKLTLSKSLVLQHVEGGEFGWVNSLKGEDLDGCAREAALWHLRGPLHKEDNWGRCNGRIDGLSCVIGKTADRRSEGWSEWLEGGADGWAGSGAEGLLTVSMF